MVLRLRQGLKRGRRHVAAVGGTQPLQPRHPFASVDVKTAMKARPFVVLRFHHFARPHQSNRYNDGVRVSRSKSCDARFSGQQKRGFLSL